MTIRKGQPRNRSHGSETGLVRRDADRLVFRGGGGCAVVVGVIFMVVAGGMLVSQIGGSKRWVPDSVIVTLFEVLFLLLGVLAAFGRWGTVIDRHPGGSASGQLAARAVCGSGGTVREWYRLIVPLWCRTQGLAAFDRVRLVKRVFHSRRGTGPRIEFRVLLEGEGRSVLLVDTDSPVRARDQARVVGGFLGLDLIDERTDAHKVVKAEELQRLHREQEERASRTDRPPPPPDESDVLRYSSRGREAVFELGPLGYKRTGPGFGCCTILAGIMAGVIFLVRWLVGGGALLQNVFLVAGIAVPAAALVAMWMMVWYTAAKTERVTASPERFRMERKSPFGSRDGQAATSELSEVCIVGSGVRVEGPGAAFTFGGGFTKALKEWLVEAVHYHLTAGS